MDLWKVFLVILQLHSLKCANHCLKSKCSDLKYRTYNGFCNNLKHPTWGTPNTTFARILEANYGDGRGTPTVAKSGKPLPSPRVLSLKLYREPPIDDPKYTLATLQYGQLVTHDMSLALDTIVTPEKCCIKGHPTKYAYRAERCFNILLTSDDPLRVRFNATCINFLRTLTNGDSRQVEQLVEVNSFLDNSLIYGNTYKRSQQLRAKKGGKLRVTVKYGYQYPPENPRRSLECALPNEKEPCFLCGDKRANQNVVLDHIQVMFLRMHNKIADILSKLNPHWTDERLYQEARRISIAAHQQVTYYEWLPIILGRENLLKNKIIYETKNFVDDYQEQETPSVFNEHATAALRFFHSNIAGRLDLKDPQRSTARSIRLRDWFDRPLIVEQMFDDVGRCITTQAQKQAGSRHTIDVLDFLFKHSADFGQDLKAIDIQRNRDHGLASYNSFRVYFGLPRAAKFEDFLDLIPEDKVKKLKQLYEHPDDVELTVGGSLERLVPGTLSGPTFLKIMLKQFYRTRVSDRFFFENRYNGLTIEQVNEIRKATMAIVLCGTGNNITDMQPRVFERISENNRVVRCSQLPAINYSLWKEEIPISH